MWEHPRADRSTALFVTLIVVSFLLMTLDVRAAGQGLAGTFRQGVQGVFTPVQRLTAGLIAPAVDLVDGVANVAGLRSENRRLRAELERLRAEMQQVEALEAENAQLRALLNMPVADVLASTPTVAAQVIAVGTSNFDYTVTIGRGLEDGLAADMPVIDERGVVGRVVSVTASSAVVSLIIDPQQSVAVRAARTRDVGVATGRGSGPLSLVIFEAKGGPLQEGDSIVTAGSDLYPPGLMVGTVTRAAGPEAGFLLQTSVEPVVRFGQLDYVRVVLWSGEIAPAAEEAGAGEVTGEEGTEESAP